MYSENLKVVLNDGVLCLSLCLKSILFVMGGCDFNVGTYKIPARFQMVVDNDNDN